MIDTVVLLWTAVVLFFVFWAIAGRPAIAAVAAWGATDGLIRGLVYAPLFMSRPGRRNGQTIGKQLTGIRVVRSDGEAMSYSSSVLREWVARTVVIETVGAALSGGIVILLNYVQPLWDERRRALHDMVASTLVLSSKPPPTITRP
jgi:uncharacterized RDD family membrane protein YckC